MFIDTHFHTNVYERYENALDQALQLMAENKILVVSNSCDLDEYEATLKIAKRSEFVLPCFGIHPQSAPDYVDKLGLLSDYLDQALMFGEIGLDHIHVKDQSQYPIQEGILERFFQAGEHQSKIVILHLDGAEYRGLEIIQTFSLNKVIIHGYSGSLETLRKMLDLGFYFSVGGNAIMDRFKPVIPLDDWNRVQQIVKQVSDDLLLVETDGPCRFAPDVSPDAPRSMPTYIKNTVAKVANIRETSVDELIHQVTDNFMKLIKDDKRLEAYASLIQTHTVS
jgi:TatD DNase family protein